MLIKSLQPFTSTHPLTCPSSAPPLSASCPLFNNFQTYAMGGDFNLNKYSVQKLYNQLAQCFLL